MALRFLPRIVAGLMGTVLLLSACSSSGSSGGSDHTFTFMAVAYSDKTQAYWEKVIAAYQQNHPGHRVQLSVVSWNDYDQKIATLLANHQQPDLLNYNTFSSYAASDLLYPANEVVSPKVFKDFIPGFAKSDEYKGTQYALPFIASARALYYNKDLFAKAEIKSPPRTWAELRDDALKIKATGAIGYGLPLGTEEAQGEFASWIFNGGGGWQTDGKWAIDSPANVGAMQFLNGLANTDKVTEVNPGTTNRTDGVWQQFAQGKIGMVLGFPGTFDGLLKQAGMNSTSYGIAAIPTKDAGAVSATFGVQDVLMAFKKDGDKHKQDVKDFLDYFYQPDTYKALLTQESFLPTTVSGSAALTSDKELGPFIKLLPDAKFAPTSDPGWTKVANDAKQNLGLAVQPGHSPQQVLGDLQQRAIRASK